MVRNVIGSVLALAGAAGAVLSPFNAWYDGRQGSDYRVAGLFNGISGSGTGAAGSILLPFAFAALVTVAGVRLRSRLLTALAGTTVLGFTILWMVRQGQAAGGLGISADGSGLNIGVAYALGGGVLLLLGALVMSGRRRYAQPVWPGPSPLYPVEGPPPQQYGDPQAAYEQNWPPQPPRPPEQEWPPQESTPPWDGDTRSMDTAQAWDPSGSWNEGRYRGSTDTPPYGTPLP